MELFERTKYQLEALCCGTRFEDKNWELNCPYPHEPALIRTVYEKKQIELKELPGLYRYSDWLPIEKILDGSCHPVTYKSEGLARHLGLENLYVTFNGYWPEKGANMQTGSFKECEAYAVCARPNPHPDKVMVVASAGNTARAFARVCSENKIPLLITIPADNLSSLWFKKPLDSCVKIVATECGSDYFDAIHLANVACDSSMFYPEGGAKNVARRDGMGLTVISAVTTIGAIPDYYFQAVGSGTGAISAWEANLRFIEDGRFGTKKMKLMISQNHPFVPIHDAWKAGSREILPLPEIEARQLVEKIDAKVLSNRKPPYPIKGGLFDALSDTNGEVLSVTNQESFLAGKLFKEVEGIDIDPAASVAVSSLIDSVKSGKVKKGDIIMLNITGGGTDRYKQENEISYAQPQLFFPVNSNPEEVKEKLERLF